MYTCSWFTLLYGRKTTQHCKTIILQFKKNEKINKQSQKQSKKKKKQKRQIFSEAGDVLLSLSSVFKIGQDAEFSSFHCQLHVPLSSPHFSMGSISYWSK